VGNAPPAVDAAPPFALTRPGGLPTIIGIAQHLAGFGTTQSLTKA